MRLTTIITVFFLLAGSVYAEKYKEGEVYKEEISILHPTQYKVGMLEVWYRVWEAEKAEKEGDLKDYKQKSPADVVVAPDGQLFVINGHHHARALQLAGNNKVYIKIKRNFNPGKKGEPTKKDWKEFYDYMGTILLPRNEDGEKIKVETFLDRMATRKIKDLGQDDYRDLAELVMKAGGFREVSKIDLQFYWAEFFRKHHLLDRLPKHPKKKDIEEVVQKGFELATSKEAIEMKEYGYVGPGAKFNCDAISHIIKESLKARKAG